MIERSDITKGLDSSWPHNPIITCHLCGAMICNEFEHISRHYEFHIQLEEQGVKVR